MTDKELLDLYREKRAVDGLNGREWHAEMHFKYDKEIELEESRQLTTKPRRDDLRIGITGRHGSDAREGNISQDAGRLYFSQREKERMEEKIRSTIIPNTHTARIAEGENER